VDVNVIDGLSAIFTGINHCPVALGKSLAARNFRRDQVKMPEQGTVFFRRVRNRRDVFAGNNQNMHRRLRMNVRESVASLILVDRFRGDASIDDSAKKAGHD
jgi:hypothetical protein